MRVIIIADLTGDPKSECLEDVADLVGGMKSPSGRFGLGDVTIYADVETLRHDLSEGHEHVSCSLPTLGWGPAPLDRPLNRRDALILHEAAHRAFGTPPAGKAPPLVPLVDAIDAEINPALAQLHEKQKDTA